MSGPVVAVSRAGLTDELASPRCVGVSCGTDAGGDAMSSYEMTWRAMSIDAGGNKERRTARLSSATPGHVHAILAKKEKKNRKQSLVCEINRYRGASY